MTIRRYRGSARCRCWARYFAARITSSKRPTLSSITPHLVAPATPGQRLASPLDSQLPSNDVDFFLNGQTEVRKRYTDFVTSGADLVGPYGHIIAPVGALPPAPGGVVVKAKD